jgi:hypothetical protein
MAGHRQCGLARGALAGGMSKEHGRERVPPAETEEMINSPIAEAATAFGVPAGSIKKAQHSYRQQAE